MSLGRVHNFLSAFCLLLIIVSLSFCNSPDSKPVSLWKNVYDTSVHYVGMQTCRSCHENIYLTYIKTGMGQSFGYATKEKSAADFSSSVALVYDSVLDFYYKPYWYNDSLYIVEYRLNGNDTVHKRKQKIDYIIGSGQHTNSHIFNINGYLYQAPITFYTQKHKWYLAPGFEKGANSRFQRTIQAECITCHNGYPDFEKQSENKFIALKTGIDCERCHGPGSLHVKERLTGKTVDTSLQPDYTIVNPRRLSTELQNNVCQRCHLQGLATLNNNKTFFDFRPGMKLSDVVNVFLPEYKGAQDKMIMASHVERMKKSKCFQESGKMSCITCHNPHISVKNTDYNLYLKSCISCHDGGKGRIPCSAALQLRNSKNNDCIVCHMPRNSSIDIPHVAVTDHFIRKILASDTADKKILAFLGMQCFNNSNPDGITKARGFLDFFEKYAPTNGLLDSALYYLNKQTSIECNIEHNRDLIRVYFLYGKFDQVIQFAETQKSDSINDAWTCYRIGEAYNKLNKPEMALNWYKHSVVLLKYSLDFENKYAICLASLGRTNEAFDVFKFILNENSDYLSANTNIGYIYMLNGNNDSAYKYIMHTNYLDPDYEQNLINMAVWYHNCNKNNEAKQCLIHLLQKHPENMQAQEMLLDLGGR